MCIPLHASCSETRNVFLAALSARSAPLVGHGGSLSSITGLTSPKWLAGVSDRDPSWSLIPKAAEELFKFEAKLLAQDTERSVCDDTWH